MILLEIRLKDFRAHRSTRFSFGPGINLICGQNGIGKTNILEAAHYLCMTKSFLTSTDAYALRDGASFFEVEGDFTGSRRERVRVRAAYTASGGKRMFLNGSPIERTASLIGQLPVVVFSPEDHKLTADGPDGRRRFMNIVISQSSSVYLADLMRYRRTLKQRNELLLTAKKSGQRASIDQLASWTEELISLGTSIYKARIEFSEVYANLLREEHHRLGPSVEEPGLTYAPLPGVSSGAERGSVENAFREAFQRSARRERERGITLVGPHRDDLVFHLDGKEIRRYGSQGQHRTFGMALKLAQYRYLFDATDEPPLMLLDDVFDNLDRNRISIFLDILRGDDMGQSIITAARKDIFHGIIDFSNTRDRLIEITEAVMAETFAAEPKD